MGQLFTSSSSAFDAKVYDPMQACIKKEGAYIRIQHYTLLKSITI